jgi:CHASE2 domain-containing sensor protein/signal transduction histidine kinase
MLNLLKHVPSSSLPLARRKDHRRFLTEWLILFAVTILILLIQIYSGSISPLGNFLYDRTQALKTEPPSNRIIIVEIDDRSIADLGGWPINRETYSLFLKNLTDTKNKPAAIGFDLLFIDPTPSDLSFSQQLAKHNVIIPAEIRYDPQTGQASAVNPPEKISSAVSQIAHINIHFDSDGVIRSAKLIDAGLPHFSLALATRQAPSPQITQNPYRRFTLKGPQSGFPTVSISDAIQPGYPLSIFKDKYVLIGATAPSLGDHYPSLYSGKQKTGTPGVVFQASLLEDILNDKLIITASTNTQALTGFMTITVVMLGMLMLTPSLQMFVTLSVVLLSLSISFTCLWKFNYWLDLTPALITMLFAKLTWAWRRMSMIASFIVSRTSNLQDAALYQNKKDRFSFTQDAILQYSSILDSAIDATRSRLDNFGKIISQLPEAILVLNHLNQILIANEKFRAQFYDKKIPLAITVEELLSRWNVTDREIQDALTSSGFQRHLTIKDEEKNEHYYLLHRVDYVLDDNSELCLLMFVDITDLLLFQQQRDRTLQLLSHDMRTPVASLMTIARSIKNVSTDKTTNIEFSQKINLHSKRLLIMMDDFILSIRADATEYKLSLVLFDSLLDEAIHVVDDLAKEKSMVIHTHTADDLLFVLLDSRLMERAIINLLVNAIRYGAAHSSIEVVVTANETHTGDKRLLCTISNLKINDEDAVEDKLTDAERGFGLGLGFVDQVVRKHHGTISRQLTVENQQRAWVTVDIPLAKN